MSTVCLDQLLKQLDETFEDKFLFGVIADHLEEIGDKRAEGMRWLQTMDIGVVSQELQGPYPPKSNNFWLYTHPDKYLEEIKIEGYRWYSSISDLKLFEHPSGSNLWLEIKSSAKNWVQYPTIHSAILCLANAYVKLQEKTKL